MLEIIVPLWHNLIDVDSRIFNIYNEVCKNVYLFSVPQRRLTEFQIIQFVIDIIYAVVGIVWHNFCFWSLGYAVSMLYLFADFYLKTYCYKKCDKVSSKVTKKTD